MTIDVLDIAARTTYVAFTLYMILVLFRWLGPWLEIDLRVGWWRFIPRVTDPLLTMVRGILPSIGPMDFAPVATLLGLWLVRSVAVSMLLGAAA